MAKKKAENKPKDTKSNAEKPVSLWGPSFPSVVGALLETRPMPREKDGEGEK
jgi:hypothetical protein